MNTRRLALGVSASVVAALWLGHASPGAQAPPMPQAPAAPPAASLTCTEMETFLKKASIGRQRTTKVGVTLPSRAMLDDGTRKHEASIQTVDISQATFQTAKGTELNFRDSWQFNVAGYELAKLLELNMVPPYVERMVSSKPASLSWWVDDAMMEKERYQKKINPRDPIGWTREFYAARLFHELVGDTDFNMTNVLIKDWRIWLIDFSRAFRRNTTVQDPKQLGKVDRKLLANLRALPPAVMKQKLQRWLRPAELEALDARRLDIVKFFDNEVATKGGHVVFYELPRMNEPCGLGL